MKNNKNYDYIISESRKNWKENKNIHELLSAADKLNPTKDHKYSNPNRFRSLGATARPVKTAEFYYRKQKDEGPEKMPIADMIMKDINKLSVTPGVWNRLCTQHSMINDEIAKTHEVEVKGPDLSITNLKKEKIRRSSIMNAQDSSPLRKSRRLSARSSLTSRDKLTKRIQKNK